MYAKYGNTYHYIWCLNNKTKLPSSYKSIHTIIYLNHQYFFTMLTSKYIISNLGIEPFLPIRKNQIVVNTWHGYGPKKDSRDSNLYKKYQFSDIIIRDIRSKMTSIIISTSKNVTSNISKSWNTSKDKFLPIGTPRNDIFFNNTDTQREKVIKYFTIDKTSNFVLYAPTFRGDFHHVDEFNGELNVNGLLKSLKIKFKNDFLLLYRSHRYTKNSELNNVIQASDYPDMQELLCAADVLITDYSSSMWDFSFTYKPCFIYAPDLEKYKTEYGFYTPVEQWPFPIAETNEQLAHNIRAFDPEKYKQAVKQYHSDLGSHETGTAREQFCKIVFE
jgi:CDP-glycerol glycerophosphotransferase